MARENPKGHDTRSLGPSDSSDSGSDRAGPDRNDNSDRAGTGERSSVEKIPRERDRGTDRVVDSSEAGLGGGLDQAEEARRER